MDNSYYLAQGGSQTGPFTGEQIRQMWRSGSIAPGALVWRQGMAQWEPVGNLATELGLQAAATPPLPPQTPPEPPLYQPPPLQRPGPPPLSAPPQDKTLAILAHLGGALFSFIPSLAIWLVKKDDDFTATNAKEALNFQITVLFAYIVCMVLTVILIGFALFWLVWLGNVALCIVGGVKASNGERYRYPFAIRLIS